MTTNVDVQKLQRQINAFGRARSPLELQADNDRIVIAGAQVFAVPRSWSFHQFLITYGLNKLGAEWVRAHVAEGSVHALAYHIRNGLFSPPVAVETRGELTAYKMNADTHAFLTFAYDMFIVADNAHVQELLIQRIKKTEQYQGARYEIFVAASLLRAGFAIEFEDEGDIHKSHCEFTATFRKSKRSFSVEAKSRHRDELLAKRRREE